MDTNEFPSSAFLINFTHLFLAQKQNLKHRYKGFHISGKKFKKIKIHFSRMVISQERFLI